MRRPAPGDRGKTAVFADARRSEIVPRAEVLKPNHLSYNSLQELLWAR